MLRRVVWQKLTDVSEVLADDSSPWWWRQEDDGDYLTVRPGALRIAGRSDMKSVCLQCRHVHPRVSNFLKTRLHRRWAPFPFANATACRGFLKSQGKTSSWFVLAPKAFSRKLLFWLTRKWRLNCFLALAPSDSLLVQGFLNSVVWVIKCSFCAWYVCILLGLITGKKRFV
jgi:hypothetical protein